VDWIHVAQGRNKRWAVVNAVMNSRVTCGADNFLPSRATVSSAVNMHTTVTVGSGGTAENLVRSQVRPCEIVVDKLTLGQILVQVLGSGSLYQYFVVGRRVKWL